MNAAIQHHMPINLKINMLELHIKTYHTLVVTSVNSKLLTLLTQHVKNVHEKICGLQCSAYVNMPLNLQVIFIIT